MEVHLLSAHAEAQKGGSSFLLAETIRNKSNAPINIFWLIFMVQYSDIEIVQFITRPLRRA